MKKWEMTRGRKDLDWTSSKQWWVMVYYRDAGDRSRGGARPWGPYVVAGFDGTNRLIIRMPFDIVTKYWGSTDDVMHTGMWEIKHEHIWARMPLEVPVAPNVEMEYDVVPWAPEQAA
jgi:hypothetical protein